MKRQKFDERVVYCRTLENVEYAKELLDHVPLDTDKPIQMVLREIPRTRSIPLNSYFHMRCSEVAEQVWVGEPPRQFAMEAWKEYFGRNVMPEIVELADGTLVSKWVESPDGNMSIISTARLSHECLCDYTTMVEAHASYMYGVRFSEKKFPGKEKK